MFSSFSWEDVLLCGDMSMEPSEKLQRAGEVEIHPLPYFVSPPFPSSLSPHFSLQFSPFPKEESVTWLDWWGAGGGHLTGTKPEKSGRELGCRGSCLEWTCWVRTGRLEKPTARKFRQIPPDIWNSSFYFAHLQWRKFSCKTYLWVQAKHFWPKATKIVLFHFPELCLAVFYFWLEM